MNKKLCHEKNPKILGDFGEKLAATFLEKKEYEIVGKNYHCAGGELDIIARKNDIIVFVEVKTRMYETFGPGEAAVTPFKRYKLIKTIHDYLHKKLLQDSSWRLDIIAIMIVPGKNTATIRHFFDIFAP